MGRSFPEPSLNRPPIAITFPSAEIVTLYPLLSPAASPSISPPRCAHEFPYTNALISGGGTIRLAVEVIVEIGDMIEEIVDVGAVKINGGSPKFLLGIVSAPSVEVTLFTVNVAVVERLP